MTQTRKALGLTFALTVLFLALGFLFRARVNTHLAWTYVGVAAFLLAWQLLLWRKGSVTAAQWAAIPSHYVQASVQFAIYVYWGWYWRNVYAEAPLILSQLVFLYILDALVTWSRGQVWRIGFGPFPIIFSTNLFLWFRDDWFVFQFVMVALGVLGKQFIRWNRDEKVTHIFNPSAFGLTVVSMILLLTGTTNSTWGVQIALTQGWPPHLFIVIFLCGLVVQFFFGVTLLTFSAVLAIALINFLYFGATGVYLFVNTNIPIAVFLGLHLLMTDPATTPRSSLGRVIFGGLYGLGVCAAFWILDAMALPSFYDKLVIVPILNLLAPALDRLTARGWLSVMGRREQAFGPRKANLVFMSCWLGVFLLMLTTGYVEAPHPGETIGFWAKAAEQNRPNAKKYLTRLLADFDRQNLDDTSIPVGVVGPGNETSRRQALGVLCNQVGAIYAQGKLIPADADKASRYFARSCDLGNTDGCENLAAEFLTSGIDPTDGTHALAVLEKLDPTLAKGRDFYMLGFSYETGRGHAKDLAQSRQYYEKGAALGDIDSCKKIGAMEFAGEGGPADHAAAAAWLQKAADARDGQSCLYLAKLYHTGDGVPRDEQKANGLLKTACDLGVKPACFLLQQSQSPQTLATEPQR